MFNQHSTALLPTQTNINPIVPDENQYFEQGDSLLIVRSSRTNGLTVAKSSGDATEKVGDAFEAHHDQALYSFGLLTVVGIVHSNGRLEGAVPNKKLSLRVYK